MKLKWIAPLAQALIIASSLPTVPALSSSSPTASSPAARPDTSDYRSILLSGAPMLDVRAPVEFDAGSIPSASVNIPLLNDEERHLIGIRYKEQGQDSAIALGNELVSGSLRDERMQEWIKFAESNQRDGYLYCFRGGLRSQTVQEWLQEKTGIRYPLVKGGYKAMRRFLIDELEQSLDTERTELVIVAGKTGVGKTRVINQLVNANRVSIDLEGLADHRGSSFGASPENPQQKNLSQIDFENGISLSLLKLLAASARDAELTGGRHSSDATLVKTRRERVFVEDEGSRIGRRTLPHALWSRMKKCNKLVMVEEDIEDRTTMILEDYVLDLGRRYVTLYGEEVGPVRHRDQMMSNLKRIRKRLGSERHDRLNEIMISAFEEQQSSFGDTALHRVWIAELLEQYYDPMYEYQLTQRPGCEVLFRGTCSEVIEWGRLTLDT